MVRTRDKNWFCQNTLIEKNNTTVLRKYIKRETSQVDKILLQSNEVKRTPLDFVNESII